MSRVGSRVGSGVGAGAGALLRLRWPVRVLAVLLALTLVLALAARGVLAPPDLVLLVVVAAALVSGSRAGAGLGLVGGWLLDLAPPGGEPLGLTALTLGAAGWVAGTAHRRAGHPWWWPVPVVALAFLTSRLVPVLLDLAVGRPVAWGSLTWQLVATATLGLVVVPLLERLDAALVRRRWA